MTDSYQHPVYLECAALPSDRRKKVESYFHIRRLSGGGDCSPLTEVGDKVYRIAFAEKEAQQRVLQKSEHVVEFADGPLVLRVRDSPSPINTSTATKPNLDRTTSLQEQQTVLGPSLPSSADEYKLELDSYIVRYLQECPEAGKKLNMKLALVGCTAQFFLEKSREKSLVSVRGLAKPGAGNDWKAEVDKIFNGYKTYYESNPRKVSILLQPCDSNQTTDEIKVYSELGIAVVVGESSQVENRLEDVKRRGSRSSQKQTTVYRLGEAKLRLLWKKIECSVRQNFPDVKVSQGDDGCLILEGSVEEISMARQVISDQDSLVFERTVFDKNPHFLSFLRKVYGGPGVLGDFLGVTTKVEVEIRDTKLNFFAFSADKLNYAVKKMQEKFKDVRVEVPNCSVVPPELREKLKSKTNDMNQGQCRAHVVLGSDNTVWLLGHTKEVDELIETATEFILDHSSIGGKVVLPFPEMQQLLPEFLQLQTFDHSGVTFYPLTASSRPMVVLEGQSNKVTEVRTRLVPLLDSVMKTKVTIDLPGAVRYFESPSGRESILRVANSHKCLVSFEEQLHTSRQNLGVAKYSLQDGLQVLVCPGDITKQYADVIVNAANEDLKHHGGVAAALSKAGGPQVQEESTALAKHGKIPTGEVVVTTGGNLKCKKLLHAVGPIRGKVGGRERMLLEKTVRNALDLAETMELRSIAIPCISSGVFGVPIPVCSEAIVTAVNEFASEGGRSLTTIILIDNRDEVVSALKDACDRLLSQATTAQGMPSGLGSNMDATGENTDGGVGGTGGAPVGVQVEVIQGTIETQQMDVLVSPMAGHDPVSTQVGKTLDNIVGPQLTARFRIHAGGIIQPGDTVLVETLPAITSKAVTFLSLVCWDNNENGPAVQVLRQGIRSILTSCESRGFRSVAFPVLGTGAALRFPHRVASKVLLEEIGSFEQNRAGSSPFLIRIVIHPGDKESSKAFQAAQDSLHLRGFTDGANPAASFYSHVSVTDDEVTAMLSGVKLQMIRGDITNGGTDVIVNTTDFRNNQTDVSKAILTAAGPAVQAELAQRGIPADRICSTGPGMLGCREIIHASFNSDSQVILKNCIRILKHCEIKGYQSVAFPAINTGAAGMDYAKACKAMLDGMATAVNDLKPNSLSLIRIVIFKQPVFQSFRSELEKRFGQTGPVSLSLRDKAKKRMKKFQEKLHRTFSSSSPQSKAFLSSKPQPAVLSVISCGPDVVKTIQRELEAVLQKQLEERKVAVNKFSRLDDMELDAVLAKVKVLGISLEHIQSSDTPSGSRGGNVARSERRDRCGSAEDLYVLKGLKEDVLSVTELIYKAIERESQDKEEALIGLTVQWSIQHIDGTWQELSLHDNYLLEQAYLKKQAPFQMQMLGGMPEVTVDPTAKEARHLRTGITHKMKRSVSETAIELPTNWEPMNGNEFVMVELPPTHQEYQTVAQAFLQAAKYTIHKIERVQNQYQWLAYSVLRQRILTKNGLAELGEKSLYHGTSSESCSCIAKGRFDRGFAGTHAARYGKGVYFAVNAAYSARSFSPADTSSLKRLFVARVLTGRYTKGDRNMVAAPARGPDTTDCYDSLVDNEQQPSMFVIFHDDQAYPEYLITFS
ncbi:protein mono-ADP-ribosyltransferase PARP14-like isoform X2 [Parambassis ranga]|uniref:Poly [ADP-ribose] polymerase n=1 Tax=Parambassis ranga TaxID=210632 RepID=A0A6P7IF93_9TELE|nr:protein mono-ADP-ribosyltransferase PARP14-like isoform X2 [Parambassis ranga]